MYRKLAIAFLGIALSSSVALAGVCTVKPEAETKKDTLPVKYQKLKKENEELKQQLSSCCEKKEELKSEIESLNSQIDSLTKEKESLTQKLSSYPSKDELISKIQQLQEELRR
jgi:chromosome segregation ATPase